MRPTTRAGLGLLTALLLTAGTAVPATAATAEPPAPVAASTTADPAAASAAPVAAARPTAPTSGPSQRVCPPATAATVTCFAELRTDVTAKTAAAAHGGYGPADLRTAYSVPTTGGAGITVATVVAYDYPTAAADLAAYRAYYGLPKLADGQFRKVDQRGGSAYPSYNAGWAGEAALDLQMITATCPACNVLLVEADTPSLGDVAAAARTAVAQGATFVSNSYGATDDGTTSLAASYAAPGVSFFASTGDEGADARTANDPPSFPATAPGVVAVGGTSLRPASNTRGWSESAWAGAGHGTACSTTYARPAFQAGVTTGCAGRAVADVAAVADPNTGVAVYVNGVWRVYGGTSAAAPIVAGIAALSGATGVTGNVLYGNASQFRDVTGGATGTCSTGGPLCAARPGWDGPTGIGTPAGTGGFVVGGVSCGGVPATVTDPSGSSAAGRYVPVSPTRVLDTRTDGGPLGQDATRALDLAALLPAAGASAVVLNVTVTNPTAAGFVTVFPAGSVRPFASNLNTVPALTRANQVTVALGPGGSAAPTAVVLYNSAGRSDLIVDLLGYHTVAGDSGAALTYHPAPIPVRAVDTRTTGSLGNAGMRGRTCVTTSLTVGGAAVDGIAAVAVTLTAVNPQSAGYLRAWNGDATTEPQVSSLNFTAGQTVPNAAVVPVSCLDAACTRVTFAVANRVSPETQVLVDVVGVYAADPAGGLVLQAASPRRIVDTRTGLGFGALGQDSAAAVTVPGAGSAAAVAVNVTAVAPSQATYLTVYGTTRPSTSNLNPVAGEVVAAAAVPGVGSGGVMRVYNGLGRVDVVVDLAGIFVPPTS